MKFHSLQYKHLVAELSTIALLCALTAVGTAGVREQLLAHRDTARKTQLAEAHQAANALVASKLGDAATGPRRFAGFGDK
ncbi:MAG TPA: hypothetical protein VF678_15730 [bacterium]